jgi:hypothetical protein
MTVRALGIVAVASLLMMSGCRTAADAATPSAPVSASADAAPVRVVAMLDKIERNGYQDTLTNGEVISWTLVSFTVVRPQALWPGSVQAYCVGHPLVGGRPLLVGQTVSLLWSPRDRGPVALEQLPELQRVE